VNGENLQPQEILMARQNRCEIFDPERIGVGSGKKVRLFACLAVHRPGADLIRYHLWLTYRFF
jgi:hypothetical protein